MFPAPCLSLTALSVTPKVVGDAARRVPPAFMTSFCLNQTQNQSLTEQVTLHHNLGTPDPSLPSLQALLPAPFLV